MVIDPICGMEVDPGTALKSTYEGKDYFFCSEACRTMFDKEPQKYVNRGEQKPGCCCCGG